MKNKNYNFKKKCPECKKEMRIIKGQGYSIPDSYNKDKKVLTWSSGSANLMEYQYWECIACKYKFIEE